MKKAQRGNAHRCPRADTDLTGEPHTILRLWTVYGWSSAPKGLQTQSLFNVQNKNISCVTQQKCWQRQVFNSPAVS